MSTRAATASNLQDGPEPLLGHKVRLRPGKVEGHIVSIHSTRSGRIQILVKFTPKPARKVRDVYWLDEWAWNGKALMWSDLPPI